MKTTVHPNSASEIQLSRAVALNGGNFGSPQGTSGVSGDNLLVTAGEGVLLHLGVKAMDAA